MTSLSRQSRQSGLYYCNIDVYRLTRLLAAARVVYTTEYKCVRCKEVHIDLVLSLMNLARCVLFNFQPYVTAAVVPREVEIEII